MPPTTLTKGIRLTIEAVAESIPVVPAAVTVLEITVGSIAKR